MHDFKVDTQTGTKKNPTAAKYFRALTIKLLVLNGWVMTFDDGATDAAYDSASLVPNGINAAALTLRQPAWVW